MEPAVKSNIPIELRNTFRPEMPGTLICSSVKSGQLNGHAQSLIKGVSNMDDIALINVEGPGTYYFLSALLRWLIGSNDRHGWCTGCGAKIIFRTSPREHQRHHDIPSELRALNLFCSERKICGTCPCSGAERIFPRNSLGRGKYILIFYYLIQI